MCEDIIGQKHAMICLNDIAEQQEYELLKLKLIEAFEKKLPEKSSFEIF